MFKCLSMLAVVLVGAPAVAQTTVTLMHDNDEWADTEEEYAQGSRLSVVSEDWGRSGLAQGVAAWLPGGEAGDRVSAGFGIGQSFFVPRDIDATTPVAEQRAYAGWLHGSGLLVRSNASRQDVWKVDVGVVGPSALSEPLEEFFHGIFNGRDMNGWDNQITDRAAVNVSVERRWRNIVPVGGLAFDVSPAVGLEVGTVSVAADAGLTVRFGAGLEEDFGAPRVGALGGSMERGDGWSLYAFASANARYQAYDLFLDEAGGEDGDAVRGGSAISLSKTRTEASLGVVAANGPARLTVAWTEESTRYDQQAGRHKYGEVTLGWVF
ncbi:MAG: lipid A deacylase LpxR family protein [Alphaproteobacteria bacterium]|jgi:lipid A 3-O-deacylase|nr:MAG: lipid A deacylase LpxR family protein [Alphaproteobacteria bacterium]